MNFNKQQNVRVATISETASDTSNANVIYKDEGASTSINSHEGRKNFMKVGEDKKERKRSDNIKDSRNKNVLSDFHKFTLSEHTLSLEGQIWMIMWTN